MGLLLGGNHHGSFHSYCVELASARIMYLASNQQTKTMPAMCYYMGSTKAFHVWEQELSNSFETAWASNLSQKVEHYLSILYIFKRK